jgi:hypothetical protein
MCRGQSRGSPKKPGGIPSSNLQKTQNAKPTSGLTQNIHTTRSTPWWPSWPTEAAQRSAPSSEVRLARGLKPPSNEVRLARGSPPPSSGVRLARGSLTSAPAPALVYGYLTL